MSPPPSLIVAAHGSADPRGRERVRDLVTAVRRSRPAVRVELGWLDHDRPTLAEALTDPGRAVVVPLLLGHGYHVGADIPAAVAGRAETVVTPPLGPHPKLAVALVARLREAGWPGGGPLVLAAAGTRSPRGVADAHAMAEALARHTGAVVTVGFGTAGSPSVTDALACALDAAPAAGTAARPAIAAYLLAPGRFGVRLSELAATAGVVVGEPLADHPAVVDVILERYDNAS